MIVVTHTKGTVVKISPENGTSVVGKPLVEVLFLLSETAPAATLVWCDSEYEVFLNREKLETLFSHNRLMLSYNVSEIYSLPDAIGYVEDSPFIKINRAVQYPTWMMSTDVGMIHASTLHLFKDFKLKGSNAFILTSIAKIGMKQGLLCYSSPELLMRSNLHNASAKKDQDISELFKFVYQHYKTRWMFLLLLNYTIFEKKLPLFSFLKGFLANKLISCKPLIGEISVHTGDKLSEESIDVIIPTIGRKQYLYDVLKDLSVQSLLPAKVIIVEQNPEIGSKSELDYLITEDWPFKISHHFTQQTGACNARNIAISHIESQWVFMADDDIRFDKNTIESTFSFLEKYKARAVTLSCLREGDVEKEPNVLQWRSFGSGCSIVASEVVKNTLFDKGFEHGFGEDTDYGMQLRNKGYDVLYNPFIKLKHLKAPVGGFRQKVEKPWENTVITPKPSPTILLYRLKHTTKTQLNGYKLLLFLKFYKEQAVKNPFAYVRTMNQRWNAGLDWAQKLMKV